MIKAVFFDVANTLLEKPSLFPQMILAFKKNGHNLQIDELVRKHRFLSEAILFPDKTSKEFYDSFNRELIYALGIIPTRELLDDIFEACTYLPWKPFEDTVFLKDIKLPIGIISNWDNTLEEKLKSHFDLKFTWTLGSQNEGLKKPNPLFYQLILDRTKLHAHEVVFVGDSIKLDIEPAQSLGINAILIDRLDLYPASSLKRINHLTDLNSFL